MTIWKRFFFLNLAGFLCLLPFPSVAKERPVSVNFWPLFHYTYDPVEEVSEIEGLGPFFYWRKDLDRKQWGIRPLLYWTRDENEPLRRLEFVYPFGKKSGILNFSRSLLGKQRMGKTMLGSFLSSGPF